MSQFWGGFIVGAVTSALGLLGMSLLFLRAFNDDNWEGDRAKPPRPT